ncbi:hypothetical protein CLF_103283 [Clonorchis sinensis]|uniref:Endonuclease/exonuclease/phosphatase domain-containing protein n=1 Tax=Clonorchis sinensis TaxID=79923 RepID=G7Y9H0_CLOSI|nr:hypothetical protein CLF_103283 [Clonorchis sinensis]
MAKARTTKLVAKFTASNKALDKGNTLSNIDRTTGIHDTLMSPKPEHGRQTIKKRLKKRVNLLTAPACHVEGLWLFLLNHRRLIDFQRQRCSGGSKPHVHGAPKVRRAISAPFRNRRQRCSSELHTQVTTEVDGSDERSQSAKPTGKPTTCADVDIGECCGNRTTTEAPKLPSSSFTPSKGASLIVGTVVAQASGSQSLKPDHREPKSPSYTQLVRLIAASWEHHQKNYSVLPPSAQSLEETPFRSNHAKISDKPNRRKVAPTPSKHQIWSSKRRYCKGYNVVYRCPSSPPEGDLFHIRTLEQLDSGYRFTHLLLAGDFNALKAPWAELQCVGSSGFFAAALTEVVQQSAWTQNAIAPTRYRAGQQPALLDLFITNERYFVDQKAFAVLRMSRRTFSRITRTDFQILYGAYVRPLLEYANPVVYSGRTKDVILSERVQRAATRTVVGLKSMDYETRLAVLDLFPLEYRRLRGDLILIYALFEQGLANRLRWLKRSSSLFNSSMIANGQLHDQFRQTLPLQTLTVRDVSASLQSYRMTDPFTNRFTFWY